MNVDRLVLHAMLACVVAAALMLGNRWVVAQQQAQTLAEVIKQGTRQTMRHRLARLATAVPGNASVDDMLGDIVAGSPHKLAATWTGADGQVRGQWHQGMPPWSQEMSERGSLDGVQFKLQGVRSAASFWITRTKLAYESSKEPRSAWAIMLTIPARYSTLGSVVLGC